MRISKYQSLVGVNCLLAAFTNGLKVINETIEDSTIFFLQDGFNINYEMKATADGFDLRFSHHFDKIAESFMRKYKINFCKNNIWHSGGEFIQFLEARFIKGYPFLIFANTGNLKYNNKYITNKDRIRAINLIGMHKKGVIISDGFVPTFPPTTYEGIMSFSELLEVYKWNKANSEYQCYNIDYDSIDCCSLNISANAINEAINRNLKNYFDMNNECSYLKALYGFCDNLINLYSISNIINKLEELSYKIFNESIIPARQLLKKALISISNSKTIDLDPRIIAELEININKWYNLTLLIIKGGVKPKKEYFEKLHDKVKMHINKEEELFKRIYQITYKG